MSNGPIKREREAWLPPKTSTPNSARTCLDADSGAGYCGRRTLARNRTTNPELVNCADCADNTPTPPPPTERPHP